MNMKVIPLFVMLAIFSDAAVAGGKGVFGPVDTEKVMVIAHRACWRLGPENSLKAIEGCIRLGVDMVEIDVRRTKDNHLIILHDDAVDRTTNGTGLVSDLTLAQIRKLKLREAQGGPGSLLTSEAIPTLEEALIAAKGRILINLDAKGEVREQAFIAIAKLGMEDQILIKSELAATDPKLISAGYIGKVHYMPLIRENAVKLSDLVPGYGYTSPVAYEIVFQNDNYLIEGIDAIKKQGSRIWVNTLWDDICAGHTDDKSVLDPDAHWGFLVTGLGVNMIQTDRPALFIKYLKSIGVR